MPAKEAPKAVAPVKSAPPVVLDNGGVLGVDVPDPDELSDTDL